MEESYKIQSFGGGLNRNTVSTQMAVGEYAVLINGRTRTGAVEAIKLPEQVSTPYAAKLQGLYTFDTFAILFGDGFAYYKNFNTSDESAWYRVEGFSMSGLVDTIYACAVPASTVNFQRVLNTEEDKSGPVTLEDELTSGSSPACVICQDGINQPWVIFSDGTGRVTKNYDEWSNTVSENREYVPIGKNMVFSGNKLYIVAKDSFGKYTQILQSVSGRPLDFVINITSAGDKGGNASTTAFQPSYQELTCLANVGALSEGFFASTTNKSYLIIPDYTRTIFAEPRFIVQDLFNTGALNQFCVTDLLGDAALIDFTGLRSFNAVQSQTFLGRNAPFSAKVNSLFGTRIQQIAACTLFDNYALFAVTTIYGQGVLVYDTQSQTYASFDMYQAAIGSGIYIKQFASIQTNVMRELFFITSDNKMWKAFSQNAETANCSLYVGDFTPAGDRQELRGINLHLNFVDIREDGTIIATSYVDGKLLETLSIPVANIDNPDDEGFIAIPFGVSENTNVRPAAFGSFKSNTYGYKVGYLVTFDFQAKLSDVLLRADIRQASNTQAQQARQYAQQKAVLSA